MVVGSIIALIALPVAFYFWGRNRKPTKRAPIVHNAFDWDSYFSTKMPPLNLANPLPPPWEKFAYDRYDMGWRMGSGEEYIGLWGHWYGKLAEKDQFAYQQKFPEPESGHWKGYYKDEQLKLDS